MAYKLVFCCRRRPELSLEEFHRTWLNDHGPLVKRLRSKIPSMTRYVQSHLVDGPATDVLRASRGSGGPYDGITEVWFESLEDIGVDTAEAIEAGRLLLEDEQRMLDLPRCSVFMTVEHEIF